MGPRFRGDDHIRKLRGGLGASAPNAISLHFAHQLMVTISVTTPDGGQAAGPRQQKFHHDRQMAARMRAARGRGARLSRSGAAP